MLQMVLVVVGFQPAQLPLLLPPGTLLLQPSLHLGLHASQCFNHSSYFPPSYLFWQKTRVILISQSYAPWFTCFRIVFVFAVLPYGKFWSATSVLHCNNYNVRDIFLFNYEINDYILNITYRRKHPKLHRPMKYWLKMPIDSK